MATSSQDSTNVPGSGPGAGGLLVRIGEQDVADDALQVGARTQELPQGPAGRAELLELGDRHAIGVVGAAELRELPVEGVEDGAGHRLADAWKGAPSAGAEPGPPRHGGGGYTL